MSFYGGHKLLGVGLTSVGTTPKHELGERVCDGRGREFVYVKASGAIAQYDAVNITDASHTVAKAGATTEVFGVAQVALADGEYGFVQVRGMATVNADATGVLARKTGATGGRLAVIADTGGAGQSAFGKTVAALASNIGSAYLF